MSSSETICDMCHRLIEPHVHYVVKIEVFADPAMPAITRDELDETDYRQKIHDLLQSMKDTSPRELQDGVHRRFEFRLCPICQRRYLENPLPSD
jgi:hypothetical protein